MPKSHRSISKPTRSMRGNLAKVSIGLAALLMSVLVQAQTNPYEHGPAPTVASLEAAAGPYAVQTSTVASQRDFGGGTVYFPTTSDGPFGVIAIVPGFTKKQDAIDWWGSRLASNGFVVITIDTKAPTEYPASRGRALMAALDKTVALSKTAGSPFFGKVDATRMAVMGHSMGGGGALEAARNNSKLKAAIPMAPWDLNKAFTRVTVPTMIISCQSDTVADVDKYANVFYDSFSATLDKAILEVRGGDHGCPKSSTTPELKAMLGKYGVAWMKRFVDNDTRYAPFLCGAPHQADLTSPLISLYKDSCPY